MSVSVNIPLCYIPTMQHIAGRKSLIGNPKSMTVLSNTGTMHFIIWGFVGMKGSGQIYLFPSSTCDLSSSKESCCHHVLSSYMSSSIYQHTLHSLTMLWPAHHFIQKPEILHALHHGSCWHHCYLVFSQLDCLKFITVCYSTLKVYLVLAFFTITVTVIRSVWGLTFCVI